MTNQNQYEKGYLRKIKKMFHAKIKPNWEMSTGQVDYALSKRMIG